MTKEFRATPDGRYIYPWPIVKGEKFLISTPNERAAHYLILLFGKGLLASPPDFESELHSDGNTPIFKVPANGPTVAFLPNRDADPGAATAIERVLSKVLWKFVETDEPNQALAFAAKRRFEAQLACSSCQSLGIGDEFVAGLVEEVLAL